MKHQNNFVVSIDNTTMFLKMSDNNAFFYLSEFPALFHTVSFAEKMIKRARAFGVLTRDQMVTIKKVRVSINGPV